MATEATKIPFVEAAAPSTPAASRVVVYAKADGLMYSKDDAGAETLMSSGSAGGVATDAIWDAKGDLAAATGANTASKLTVGANDTILMADSGQATGLKWVASQTPSTQAFSDAAAEGTADTYARGDHKHAMPANPASGSVPGWIAKYIGTTDTTHFYWDGNDLAGFTEQKPTGNSTWAEGLNLVSVLMDSTTANDAVAQLIAQTISTGDAWEVGINVSSLFSDSAGDTTGNRACGIIMSDGVLTTSACVAAHIQIANDGTSVIMVGRHGTITNIATAPWVSSPQLAYVSGGWLWIRLKYSASNTFQANFSSSYGAQYSAFEEADISVTLTPTHVGIFGWNHGLGPAMFTFGPLLKV